VSYLDRNTTGGDAMTDEQRAKYHEYLEQLRASGRTNMFGAAPYLMSRFGLERREAESVLLDWMDAHERAPAGAA
jgi:hypothetical protein